jgi:inosine-uridine nucleoside N-ribohydrolase
MPKVIIDTDIGDDIDDALAIGFALSRPELQVVAVTTVEGPVEPRARIVAKMARITGAEFLVGAGVNLPSRALKEDERRRYTAETNYGPLLNQYPFVKPEDPEYAAHYEDAVGLIIRLIEEGGGETGIIALGPLSNLAAALQRKPSIAKKIPWISLMGGEVRLNHIEHNIAWDPNAAAVVFDSGIPIFMATWDVSRRVAMGPLQCDLIKQHGTPLCQCLSQLIELWWPYRAHKEGPVLYDVSPVLGSFAEKYFTTHPLRIGIETTGEHTRGLTTVCDGEPNARVTVDIMYDEVITLFMKTLLA